MADINEAIEHDQAKDEIMLALSKALGRDVASDDIIQLWNGYITTHEDEKETLLDVIGDSRTNHLLRNITFSLPEDFINQYRGKQPNWGPMGYLTFKRTYARRKDDGYTEEFWETVQRVVEGTFKIQKWHCKHPDNNYIWSEAKAIRSAKRMFEKIWEFKFLPAGRGLWMMGTEFVEKRGSMALNNCFAGETEIITRDGIKTIKDCVNTNQYVLTDNGKWVEAPIQSFGKQKLMKITLKRNGCKKEVFATPDHRWFVNSRKKEHRDQGNFEVFTKELEPNFNLAYSFSRQSNVISPSPFGIAHGIAFGDGTHSWIQLCNEKRELQKYFPLNPSSDEKIGTTDTIRIASLPNYFKDLPSIHENSSYLYGWLAGYFAADGTCKEDGSCSISSANLKDLLFVKDVCSILGIGYYSLRKEERISNLTNKEHTMYILTLMRDTLHENFFLRTRHITNFKKNGNVEKKYWQVESVESTDREEEVYCATVDDSHKFTLADNILTGNCGFCSTKLIKQQGSRPFVWGMDAEMLGVGIGFDVKGGWIGSDDDFDTASPEIKANYVIIQTPEFLDTPFVIPDSREGWIQSVAYLLDAFLLTPELFNQKNYEYTHDPDRKLTDFPVFNGIPKFDYSKIRRKGEPIKGFGGRASGPGPLIELHAFLITLLSKRVGKPLTTVDIVDIFNNIGKCVVAGNVRRCLAESMEVHTNRGLLPINKVLLTDKVLVHDGSYRQIKNIFKQGKQNTIKIRTTMGDIICTPNHRMAIFNGLKSYTWKEAEKINPKTDRLLSIPHTEGKNTITPEFAWLIGYYHGDGHSDYLRLQENGHGGGTVSFAMSKKNYDKGLKTKFDFVLNQIGYEAHPYHQGNSTHIGVYRKEFAEKMITYKQPNAISIIPREIWEGNAQIRSAYLAGLCDSDGGVRNTLVWTKYPEFARQIQKIALSLGIATTYHKGRDKVIKETTYHGDYSVTLRGLRSQKIASQLIEPYCAIWKVEQKNEKKNGLSLPYQILIDAKNNNKIDFQPLSSGLIRPTKKEYEEIDMGNGQVQLQEIKYRDANYDTLLQMNLVNEHWIPIEIETIEDVGIHETYDLEVDGDHEFVCENVLVHNSAEIALGYTRDTAYTTMKNPETMARIRDTEPERDARWASNNSVYADIGQDYSQLAQSIAKNGEPGIIWLDNIKAYGRVREDERNWTDKDAEGVNPCFHGDTLIAVADGRGAVSIHQLAEEGRDVPVYSVNTDGMIEIKMGRHPRITGYDQDLVKITLDDGSSLIVTPNHKMRLLNGDMVEAKDLRIDDSLTRFSKYTTKFCPNGTDYLMVRTNTLDMKKNRIAEHRLIARFHHPDQWDQNYDENEEHGWLHGNLVVHHKNENGLDNRPENLEILKFSDHNTTHGFYDVSGADNPMYGKTHSKSTKAKIGAKTVERCADPEYIERFRQAVADGLSDPEVRQKLSEARYVELRKYYEEFERTTDLDTVWIEDRLFVKKPCETCGSIMILPIQRREQAYCNRVCMNKNKSHTAARTEGQKAYFADKQRDTLHHQIMIYKDLEKKHKPSKKEWEAACKANNISFRLNPHSNNPHALKNFAELQERAATYNHRVAKIERLSDRATVYNITVDDNHTVCVVTSRGVSGSDYDGIAVANCGEQVLESFELCCLVESFPSLHDGGTFCLWNKEKGCYENRTLSAYEEYEETLKYAYMYAKTVTLLNTHWAETNNVMRKNRRVGISMTGIIDAFVKFGRQKILNWCEAGYAFLRRTDIEYCNDWLCVNYSKKITTVKPSGTTSLLPGVSSGIHFPHSERYIRRIRIAKESEIEKELIRCGIRVEPDVVTPHTSVAEIPIHEKHFQRCKDDVTLWEQIENAIDLQHYWSDNAVSITATFKKAEVKDIPRVLEHCQTRLKGLSLLPAQESKSGIQLTFQTHYVEDFRKIIAAVEQQITIDGIFPLKTELKEINNEPTMTITMAILFAQANQAFINRVVEKYNEYVIECQPYLEVTATQYAQMPLETITKEQYDAMVGRITRSFDFSQVKDAGSGEWKCETDMCAYRNELYKLQEAYEKVKEAYTKAGKTFDIVQNKFQSLQRNTVKIDLHLPQSDR